MPKSVNPLLLRRSTSSPISPNKRTKSAPKDEDTAQPLDDTGRTPSLAPLGVAQDSRTLIRHVHTQMWADIPDRAAGMGSERISEILRFRRALPKIVSAVHLHALSVSTTESERELARLVAMGQVRKVVVPGRGKGGAAVGEGVILVAEWKKSVNQCGQLSDELKAKYLHLMDDDPTSAAVPTSSMSDAEVRDLVTAGYFTSPAALVSAGLSNLFASPGSSSLSGLPLSGTRAATGTLAAIGGQGAVHESGGGGSTLATRDNRMPLNKSRQMTFSLPGTGAYLKLLIAARQHLLFLLKQTSPRFREATMEFLKEKWDGNVPNDATSRAKRARGEWTGVLPGKTKKWKEFYGLEFEWVLAECVGSGLVECFETGSVGLGVRGI